LEEEEEEELLLKDQEDLKIRGILKKAINLASDKCKKIIELHLEGGLTLREIWKKLGYKSYQAIVQTKYNCKKKLGNYIFLELNKEKKRAREQVKKGGQI